MAFESCQNKLTIFLSLFFFHDEDGMGSFSMELQVSLSHKSLHVSVFYGLSDTGTQNK